MKTLEDIDPKEPHIKKIWPSGLVEIFVIRFFAGREIWARWSVDYIDLRRFEVWGGELPS